MCGRKGPNLQQAGGSREAQCERLTADVEGVRLGLLRAHRERVHGPSCHTSTRQPEQRVRAESHRRVRRFIEVEDGQTQRWQTNHERRLEGAKDGLHTSADEEKNICLFIGNNLHNKMTFMTVSRQQTHQQKKNDQSKYLVKLQLQSLG